MRIEMWGGADERSLLGARITPAIPINYMRGGGVGVHSFLHQIIQEISFLK